MLIETAGKAILIIYTGKSGKVQQKFLFLSLLLGIKKL